MNADERELLEGLHALASDGPSQAPVQIEERLVTEFRNRSRRRRARAWISAAGIGAVAAAIAVLVWMAPLTSQSAALQPVAVADETTANFYPLPDADSLPPVESGLVVRVELPMASLQMIGFPVNQDGTGDPVEAELLLGQDGLARAVRLVE